MSRLRQSNASVKCASQICVGALTWSVHVWLSNFLSSSSRGIWGIINPPSESLVCNSDDDDNNHNNNHHDNVTMSIVSMGLYCKYGCKFACIS